MIIENQRELSIQMKTLNWFCLSLYFYNLFVQCIQLYIILHSMQQGFCINLDRSLKLFLPVLNGVLYNLYMDLTVNFIGI